MRRADSLRRLILAIFFLTCSPFAFGLPFLGLAMPCFSGQLNGCPRPFFRPRAGRFSTEG